MHLSSVGPQTINETVKKIKHSYKPSWIAFNSLEKKGIIKKGKMKEYRNREYPMYWFTEDGVFVALNEEASPSDLLTKSREVYPKNQKLQYGLEMAQIVNPEVFKVALSAIMRKGTLEPADLGAIMITQMEADTSLEKLLQGLETMRKHPKEYEEFKQRLATIQQNFNRIAEAIKESDSTQNTAANRKKH